MRQQAVPLLAAATIISAISGVGRTALAQTAPPAPIVAQAAPAPVATEKPPSKFNMKIETYTSGTNNQMVGPGTTPVGGPNFSAGGNPAPGTPYDMFSGSPLVTGEGISQDFLLKPSYAITPSYDLTATIGYGSVSGTANVVNYWGDAVMPSINANIGTGGYQLRPAFPTHNGQDPVSATRLGVLSGAIVDHGGNGALTVGWFSLHQNVPWLLTQAPWTNTPFQLAPQIPQSIGNGSPSNDVLKAGPTVLALAGADFWAKKDINTLEITSAFLPAPTTSSARILSASFVQDHGGGLTYSASLTGLTTWGPETARVGFGTPFLVAGAAQSPALSTVFYQKMVVGGAGAIFPIGSSDAELRYGYSCYTAVGTAIASGACTSGSYYYGKVHHGFSKFDLSLEGVRFEPTYAPAILDYGTQENVWQLPSAWPAPYLRGNYQLVDTSTVGPNRQGGRLSSTFIVAGVEVRFAFAQYGQITSLNPTTSLQPGFVEPYFLPQTTLPGSLGQEQHWEGWFNYHASFADVTLDLSQVNTWRQAPAGSPNDNVVMQYPSGVLTLSRQFGPKVFGAAGVGRFGLNGQFNTSGANNASLAEDLVFAGLELRPNATSGYGMEWRLYSVSGIPTTPAGLSPAFHGPQILFYQRFKT